MGRYQNDSNVCKWCGKRSLHWEDTPEGWKLCDRYGEIHTCYHLTEEFKQKKTLKNRTTDVRLENS